MFRFVTAIRGNNNCELSPGRFSQGLPLRTNKGFLIINWFHEWWRVLVLYYDLQSLSLMVEAATLCLVQFSIVLLGNEGEERCRKEHPNPI